MVHDSEQTDTTGTNQFEKNRFFDGKLMTAGDMRTEQQYHAERLELVTRHTTGSGIVRGLGVRSVESTDGELAISVDSGVAIDGVGRPIVVDSPTTKSVPAPEGEEIHLFVRFDEVALESVPVPDADGPPSETEANRHVEVFELIYRESPPDQESIPMVDLAANTSADDPRTVADRIAAGYHEKYRSDDVDGETAVYLGGFEREADGSWVRSQTAPQPEYAYDHDLLYATLIEHIADTENPHQTEVEAEPPEPQLDPAEVDGIHERVDYLQSELADVKRRQQTATTHLLRKTLDTTARLFRSTAEMFADHSGPVSKTAREIAQQVDDASRAESYTDTDQYLSTLRELYPSLAAFGDQLSGITSESTVDRYLDAVAELREALEADQPVEDVAVGLDGVAEAAVDLDLLHSATAEL
ncbi:hypothetical protein halTADL_2224 [Halohasta litchfieldiae]|jgi:hypothetical protein|uniref:Uncharacterized protein n=1 Tax=Halohasta litchfieldiae TaxID=1073996 RepID=A0A1H6VMT4_9EURY|nr:hypothetical protein [Halohasta litchfieldiae]ATW88971.1 hypothetical protein halTADL_2224 [Halohasta litchfieldiae]SEJ01582.1 hypothetical protein SAMN05444271_11643 [Halohasta litchfieldiae]